MSRPCPLVGSFVGHRCGQCGGVLTGRQTRWCGRKCVDFYGLNHWWTNARGAAIRRARGICDQCGEPGVEVNHVEPRVGRGYGSGCHNHQTNLQLLCHSCHVAETTRQRRERPIWDALEAGAITSDQAQVALDRAYWWKRGLPDPDAVLMDSLWDVA